MKSCYIIFILLLLTKFALGQTDTISIDKLRTESGVDPTRVSSRIGYSVLYFDKSDNRASINNRLNLTIGVNRWSFSIKPEIASLHNGLQGTGFKTGFSDLKFSILCLLYKR